MFSKRRKHIVGSLREEEVQLIRRIVGEYRELLATESNTDPVHKRLFPSASLDDKEVERDFREMSELSLLEEKLEAARMVEVTLEGEGPWERKLTGDESDAWLKLLTDLRLVLGVRLAVTEETMETPVDASNPEQWPMAVLHYLGGLQESLVEASF